MKRGSAAVGVLFVIVIAAFLYFVVWPLYTRNVKSGAENTELVEPVLKLSIQYSYEGRNGIYGIADTAAVYLGGAKIASAESLDIINNSSGANSIRVRETQYDSSGYIIYEGYLFFQFTGVEAEKVDESVISGTKRYNVFRTWPEGSPGGFGSFR